MTQDVDKPSHCERDTTAPSSQSLIEILTPDPADELAERLYLEVRRGRAVSDLDWVDLDEGEREFYRTCVEGLLLDWRLVVQAHERQISPVRLSSDPE